MMRAGVVVFLLAYNAICFFLMGWDKQQSRKKGRRVPERRLFTLAFLFGATGIWIGMRVFHHKTKHASFRYGVPLLLLWNAVVGIILFRSIYLIIWR